VRSCGLDSSGPGYGAVATDVNTVLKLCSIKGGEFLDQLDDYQHLKKDSAPWRYLFSYLVHIFIYKSLKSFLTFWD
jgi:hypothetical protein